MPTKYDDPKQGVKIYDFSSVVRDPEKEKDDSGGGGFFGSPYEMSAEQQMWQIAGTVLSMAGLFMRNRLYTWLGLFCTLAYLASSTKLSRDWMQVITQLVFAVTAIVSSYVYASYKQGKGATLEELSDAGGSSDATA